MVALISDTGIPEEHLNRIFERLKKINSTLPVVVITPFATIDSAVEAMRRGASDYIEKPLSTRELPVVVRRALEETRFRKSPRGLCTSREVEEVISSLNSPLRRLILSHLAESRKRLSFTQLQRSVGERDHKKFYFHLKRLKEAKLVVQDGDRRYILTERGRRALEAINQLAEFA
ncbi:DUF7347 domain-containing protein [Candidatus Pyrohabitans sp.]